MGYENREVREDCKRLQEVERRWQKSSEFGRLSLLTLIRFAISGERSHALERPGHWDRRWRKRVVRLSCSSWLQISTGSWSYIGQHLLRAEYAHAHHLAYTTTASRLGAFSADAETKDCSLFLPLRQCMSYQRCSCIGAELRGRLSITGGVFPR